jgi:hypothetical protein
MRSLVILAIAAVVAACSSGAAASPSPAPTTAPSPSASAVPYPIDTSAGSLVLRISTAGGFIGPSADLARIPELSLYGDGRVVLPWTPTGDAPLIPGMLEERLSAAEVQKVLAAADAAGLLGADATYASPGMPDAGMTTFRVRVAGTTHVVSASGLGADPSGLDPADPRAALAAFRASVGNLAAMLGRSVEPVEFHPAGYRVYLSAAQLDPTAPSSATLDWPLASDPATGAPTLADGVTCQAVMGADAATFAKAAASATPTTLWRAASGLWLAQVRPLLPDEHGC